MGISSLNGHMLIYFPLSLQLVQCCKPLPDFHEPQIHTSRQIGDISSTEATHVLFTSSRMVASSGRASGKSKITRKQIVGCTLLEYRDYLIPISRCLRVTLPASEMHMPIQTVCGRSKIVPFTRYDIPFCCRKTQRSGPCSVLCPTASKSYRSSSVCTDYGLLFSSG